MKWVLGAGPEIGDHVLIFLQMNNGQRKVPLEQQTYCCCCPTSRYRVARWEQAYSPFIITGITRHGPGPSSQDLLAAALTDPRTHALTLLLSEPSLQLTLMACFLLFGFLISNLATLQAVTPSNPQVKLLRVHSHARWNRAVRSTLVAIISRRVPCQWRGDS